MARLTHLFFRSYITPLVPSFLLLVGMVVYVFGIVVPGSFGNMEDEEKERCVDLISVIYSEMESVENSIQDGRAPEEGAKAFLLDRLSKISFGGESNEYFWVIGPEENLLMHPIHPEYVTAHSELIRGMNDRPLSALLQDMRQSAVEHPGGTFFKYRWQDSSENRSDTLEKIAFLRYFAPWGWTIGTAVALEDIRREMGAFRNQLIWATILFSLLVLGVALFLARRNYQYLLVQQQTLAHLAAQEERFRTLFETSPAGITIVNLESRQFLQANQAALDQVGYTLNEAVGRTSAELGIFDPLALREQIARAGKDVEHLQNFPIPIRRRDSTFRDVLLSTNKISIPGSPDPHLISISVDVTDQIRLAQDKEALSAELKHWTQELEHIKRQYALFNQVYENSTDAVFITDSQNRFITVNRAFTQITGYSMEEVRGKTPAILKSGKHSHEFYQQMWMDLTTQHRFFGEMVNRRKNGEVYPVELAIDAF
ncbi:MAG TPA: PAS domain S-box protein, partial [Fibrobacteraceae bacterium]|nr:PAS domain S-box protein [Fibrobacteraceae bacterium]